MKWSLVSIQIKIQHFSLGYVLPIFKPFFLILLQLYSIWLSEYSELMMANNTDSVNIGLFVVFFFLLCIISALFSCLISYSARKAGIKPLKQHQYEQVIGAFNLFKVYKLY